VLLDDAAQVEAGDTVTGSGEVVRVPVGEALLGRVVDPLGRPLDGGAPIRARRFDPVERPAPAIIERDLVVQPVQTGTLAIDAMFAIGRGQRELILGDRATGKTALAVDTIINQRTSDMICVYVAIGQKSSAVARVVDQVRRHGAPDRTIFVVASPPRRRGCNGSRRSRASRWPSIFGMVAAMRWWCSTISPSMPRPIARSPC
jgi:F-type H+-transporting ATPase subunit alpha